MTLSRFTKNPLITGTLLMTAAGIISRIVGFFYRIFLSRAIGAEALGIYQLIAPVFSMCFALTASAIQTSISKFVGDSIGKCQGDSCGEKRARTYLMIGLILSCTLSIMVGAFIYCNAKPQGSRRGISRHRSSHQLRNQDRITAEDSERIREDAPGAIPGNLTDIRVGRSCIVDEVDIQEKI